MENQLKVLMSPDRTDPLWEQELVPTDAGSVQSPHASALREASQLALERRPELRLADLQVDIVKVQERLNRTLKLPRVDLVASYTFSGLAGAIAPPPAFFSQTDTRLYERVSALSQSAGLDPIAPPVGGIPPAAWHPGR